MPLFCSKKPAYHTLPCVTAHSVGASECEREKKREREKE